MADKITEKLKAIRKENKLTQAEFAEILGVNRSTYAHQERNGIPSGSLYNYAQIIFDKFSISLGELIDSEFNNDSNSKNKIIKAIAIIEKQLNDIKKAIK